jgi:2-aminoadipate transaminase
MTVLPEPGVISFARGLPSPEMFPVAELERAAARAFARHAETALNYGGPAGFPPLRELVAERHGASAEQVVITPGSCMLLSLLVRELTSTAAPVAIESPTYDRMRALLRQARVPVITVARDSGSGRYAEASRTWSSAKPAFSYVMPTFHNPTGGCLPLEARKELVDLAIRHQLLLVEDDPYGLLRIDGEPQPTLRELLCAREADHLSVYVSSFSKVVAPGLRVGYAVVPQQLSARIQQQALDTYVSPPLWPQAEMYEFLADDRLEPQLARVRALLRERRDALVARLEERLSGLASWTVPEGGFYLWLQLPARISAVELLESCRSPGVTFVPGASFAFDGNSDSAARLVFSYLRPTDIAVGVDRLTDQIMAKLATAVPQ